MGEHPQESALGVFVLLGPHMGQHWSSGITLGLITQVWP